MLNTFIDRIKEIPKFVGLFITAFTELAACPESQINKTGKEIKMETPPFLIKYVDSNYKRNLNRDILKYIKYIKEFGLEYLRKFLMERSEV